MDRKEPLILVVEDDEFSRRMILSSLKGNKVIYAKDANEAISAYKLDSPDIIFLDIVLPDASGISVLKMIKLINPEAFVVMLTADTNKNTVMKSLENGASGYIAKPFSRLNLEKYINKFMEDSYSDEIF